MHAVPTQLFTTAIHEYPGERRADSHKDTCFSRSAKSGIRGLGGAEEEFDEGRTLRLGPLLFFWGLGFRVVNVQVPTYARNRVKHESIAWAFAILRSSAVAFASCAAVLPNMWKQNPCFAHSTSRIWDRHQTNEGCVFD